MKNIILLLASLLVGCTHIAEKKSGPSRIIDAHVHLDRLDQFTAKEFVENNIVGVVAHTQGISTPVPKARADVPFQVTQCAGLNLESTVSQIETGLKNGNAKCLKIYLGYVPRYAYDPFYRPFYHLAQKYNVPVVFHTGDTDDKSALIKYTDPLTIDEVAVEFPKINFVIAHVGNPWFHSAAEVIYKNDNVYVDLSALILDDAATKDKEVVDDIAVRPLRWVFNYVGNPKKFLFGTDWPLVRTTSYIEMIKRAIPEKDWEDVFFQNAVTLFKMPFPASDKPQYLSELPRRVQSD